MPSEDTARRSTSGFDSTFMANTELVDNVFDSFSKSTNVAASTAKSTNIRTQQEAQISTKTPSDSSEIIRQAYRQQNISERATEIIMHAWKPGTQRQYNSHIRKWRKFCAERQTDSIRPPVELVVEFLTEMFDQGLGYNSLNSARSALSQYVVWDGHVTAGAHPYVIRFMKGVYNFRPPVPRYEETWDVGVLLWQVKNITRNSKLSLKDLTLKTVTLSAIVLAARAQTLTKLKTTNMQVTDSHYSFKLGASDLKQSRPGYIPPVQKLPSYPLDRSVCVYTTLKEYLKRTKDLRGNETALFISYQKPHNRVSTSTISRWIKTLMAKAGIDVARYLPHSVRAASTSKAFTSGATIDEILALAGWSNAKTFAQYYNKPIEIQSDVAAKVMAT